MLPIVRLAVLVQQESEIGGRLMGGSDGQEHVRLVRESLNPVYRDVTFNGLQT